VLNFQQNNILKYEQWSKYKICLIPTYKYKRYVYAVRKRSIQFGKFVIIVTYVVIVVVVFFFFYLSFPLLSVIITYIYICSFVFQNESDNN
jgi:hypothetical protein